MKHKQIILSIAATLALTACGGAKAASAPLSELTPNPPAVASSAPSPSASSATTAAKPSASKSTSSGLAGATPSVNARGNLVKKIGQLAGIGPISTTDSSMLMTFRVTKIQPNFKCDNQYASPPQNGHALAITIDETVSPKATGDNAIDVGYGSWQVKIIKPNGDTENGTQLMYGCAKDTEVLPNRVGAGEHAKGMIVIDTSQTKGAVVLSSYFLGQGGWEYSF